MKKCEELCGCGMPCTVKGEHRDVGGEPLHACDVHWPEPKLDRDDFHEGLFETIELVTGDDHAIVAYGNLAPYTVYPEVVMWGTRVFKLKSVAHTASGQERRAVYKETFAVMIVQWKSKLEQEADYNGGKDL